MTIGCIGGTWDNGDMPGVICREVYHTSSYLSIYVASSDISRLIKYYTDWHDVDEDKVTTTSYGGHYSNGLTVGVMNRTSSNPTNVFDYVASSNTKKSHSYTDEHDVDEDLRTILAHGGFWTYDNTAGIMYRDVRRENFYHFDVVASYV